MNRYSNLNEQNGRACSRPRAWRRHAQVFAAPGMPLGPALMGRSRIAPPMERLDLEEGSATTRIRIPLVALLSTVLLLASGCSSTVDALDSAIDSTTAKFQSRYGQSEYYENNSGGDVDRLSGYDRIPGKVAVYNRTSEPLKVTLMGTVAPGGVVSDQFHASVSDLEFIGVDSGRKYGSQSVGPTDNGTIIVVTDDGVESR